MAEFFTTPGGIAVLILAQVLAVVAFVMISLLFLGVRRPQDMGRRPDAPGAECGWRLWAFANRGRRAEIRGKRSCGACRCRQDPVHACPDDQFCFGYGGLGGDPV